MKKSTIIKLAAAAFVVLLLVVAYRLLSTSVRIAVDAYIYGYPLVTFDTARRQQTKVATPDAEHAPMGQLIKMRNYPAVDNRCCAAPNADTLYTIVWLDVSIEPWVFSISDMGDRYYIMPMLDGFSEVFKVAGSRTTGGKAQTYAITGPGWSGTLPDGASQVESPTGMVWILGRIYSTGTPGDYEAVHALQDKFSVVPLSFYGKPYTPPPGVVDSSFDMKTAVRKQVNSLGIDAYFDYLAKLLMTNPPKAEDAPIVARMARIGLVPGQDFDPANLSFLDRKAIKLVPKLALLEMARHLKKQKTTNGWLYFTEGVGNFGTDYVLRGMANLLGPGWNRPQDAVYPLSQRDANGDEYDGAKHKYVMRFENVRGQRYTEIFLIGGNAITKDLKGGVYNTIGLNSSTGTGDSSPKEVLDKVDVNALKKQYDVLSVFKNGPRLWTVDWVEVMVGAERDFDALKARWVMWLDVPKEMRTHESVAYKSISGKRDTQLGINKGSPAFILDDSEGNSWVMKSASLIVDPNQTYDSLKDLGGRLKLAPGWKFRAVVLDRDLVVTPNNGAVKLTQDDLGNTYDRVGGAYSNYKP